MKQRKDEHNPVVNIVKKEESVEVLKAIGAENVVNSSLSSFIEEIGAAVHATVATVALDSTGCGILAMDMLVSSTHEAALRKHHASNDTVEERERHLHDDATSGHSSDDLPPPAVGREGCRGNRTCQPNFTTPQHLTTRPNSKHTSTGGRSDNVSPSTLYRTSGSPKGEAVGGPSLKHKKRSSNTNIPAMLSTKTVLHSKWHELCAGTHMNDASTRERPSRSWCSSSVVTQSLARTRLSLCISHSISCFSRYPHRRPAGLSVSDPWISIRLVALGGATKASVASSCSSASLRMLLAVRVTDGSCSGVMKMATRGYLWPSRCVGSRGVIVDAVQAVRPLVPAMWR